MCIDGSGTGDVLNISFIFSEIFEDSLCATLFLSPPPLPYIFTNTIILNFLRDKGIDRWMMKQGGVGCETVRLPTVNSNRIIKTSSIQNTDSPATRLSSSSEFSNIRPQILKVSLNNCQMTEGNIALNTSSRKKWKAGDESKNYPSPSDSESTLKNSLPASLAPVSRSSIDREVGCWRRRALIQRWQRRHVLIHRVF